MIVTEKTKETSQNILCNSKIISEELHKSALASHRHIAEHSN